MPDATEAEKTLRSADPRCLQRIDYHLADYRIALIDAALGEGRLPSDSSFFGKVIAQAPFQRNQIGAACIVTIPRT